MTHETKSGAVIDDRRTAKEVEQTIGYVVATDRFMSGWGHAPGRSLFAVPFRNHTEAAIVEQNMRRRSEMIRVRVVGEDYRPKLYRGDHFSIRSMAECSRFFQEGGF